MSSREVYRGLVGESRLEIGAKITDDVDATTRGRVHLKLDDVTIGDQKLPGRIFATVSNAELLSSLSAQGELRAFREVLPSMNEIFIKTVNPNTAPS